MQPLVVLPRELGHVPPAATLIGRKAHGLAQLQTLKARVPRFGVITVAAFDAFIEQPALRIAMLEAKQQPLDTASLVGVGEQMTREALSTPLPDDVLDAIAELKKAFADDDTFAVRASVCGDDLIARALAGALDAALATRDVEGCVHRLFSLAFHPRTLRALSQAGLSPLETRLAVVVQRQVASEQSGICLTLDTQDATDASQPKAVLYACHGLAGGIGGRVGDERIARDATTVLRPAVADDGLPDDARVTSSPTKKADALRIVNDAGRAVTRMQKLDDEQQMQSSLSTVQARLVVKEALRLEAALGKPQAISFSFAGRLLHLLDVEPLLVPGRRIDSGRLRVWDERLVPAPLSRPASVLSFSVWQRAVARGFERAGRIAGVRGPVLEELRPHFRRALGVITGRLTGNVDAISALIDLLPFADKARTALARTAGQPELSARTDGAVFVAGKKARSLWARTKDRIDESRWPGQLDRLAAVAHGEGVAFLDEVDAALLTVDAAQVMSDDPDSLCDGFEAWAEHLSRCVAAATLSGVAMSLVEQLLMTELSARGLSDLRADLLISDETPADERADMLSAVRRLFAMARMIDADPALLSICNSAGTIDGAEMLRDALMHDPACKKLKASVAAFMELDPPESTLLLEEPRLREKPLQVLSLLLRVWRGGGARVDVAAKERDAQGRRKKADYAVEAACAALPMLESVPTKKRLQGLIAHYRQQSALFARSWLPLERTVTVLRLHALALGERLFEHGLLEQSRDVFLLQDAEIAGVIRGSGPNVDVRPLVVARRRAAAARPTIHAVRTETRGVVATSLMGDDDDDAIVTSPGTAPVVAGVAAVCGDARGAVRLVEASNNAIPTSISVAPSLSFAELPLWALSSGVVVERGAALSPVAIALGRLAVPTVVMAPQATVAFRGDEHVELDGTAGIVRRASPENQKPPAQQPEASETQAPPTTPAPGRFDGPAADAPGHAQAEQRMGAFLREAISTDASGRPLGARERAPRRPMRPGDISSEMPMPPGAGFFDDGSDQSKP